jgi:hypothetical protein
MDIIPRKKKILTEEIKNFQKIQDSKEDTIKYLSSFGYSEDWIEEMIKYEKIKIKNEKYHIGVNPYTTYLYSAFILSTEDGENDLKIVSENKTQVLVLKASDSSAVSMIGEHLMLKIYDKLLFETIEKSKHSIHNTNLDGFCKSVIKFFN